MLVVVDRRTDEPLPLAAEPSAATNAPLVRFSQLRRMAASHSWAEQFCSPGNFTLAAMKSVCRRDRAIQCYCTTCRHAVGQFATYG